MDKVYITADQMTECGCEKSCQETAINWLRDSDTMTICTSDPTFATKMRKMVEKDPEHYKCYFYPRADRRNEVYFFEVPVKALSLRAISSKQSKKHLSSEERQAIAQRFKAGRNKKKVED